MSKGEQDSVVATASRRAALKKLGKYAAVSAPTVTVLLAATAKPRKAVAASIPF